VEAVQLAFVTRCRRPRNPGRPPRDSATPREATPLVLNAAERRGALVLLLLLAIGSARDLWRAWRPLPAAAPALAIAPADSAPAATPDTGAARTGAPGVRAAVPLDLNRADVAELDALPGIGPVLARRIVEFRREHGPFRRVEELRAVRGVGPRLLERIRPRVEVGAAP
jgi:competence protein ComEA